MTLDYEVYKEGGILNDRYQKIEDISEGSYGHVSLAKDTQKKKLVAVKHFFKLQDKDGGEEEEDDKIDEALCEINIQKKLGNEHKNIVRLLDHFDSYIILEYCSGGDLYEAIKSGLVPKKTKKITHILEQMIDAVQFCHDQGVYHRDIKPENILITNLFEWNLKLSDWGLATTSKTSFDRNVGSERYMAPELFECNLDIQERKEPYSCPQVDVWSLGIVFLNTVFSKNPFRVANQTEKAFCYFAANREALFDVFSTMSLDFFQVLRYSLTIDPANRDLQKMRRELSSLSEYTLDDEYYNSLDDDLAVEEGPSYVTVPPSSAPVRTPPSLLLTPAASGEHKKHIEKRRASDAKDATSVIGGEKSKNLQEHDARAKSVPKFKFQKRSHPSVGKAAEAKPIKYNPKNNHHHTYGKFRNNFHHARRKPIKNSRKPLGISSPNTRINKFFDDYQKARNNMNNYHYGSFKNNNNNNNNNNVNHNSSEWHNNGFNTRDFFTPPSVHKRYMEGIFSSGRKYGHQFNNGWHSHNRHRHSSFSHNSFNSSKAFSRGNSPGKHSPGKYIPPNARSYYNNWTLDPDPPNTNTYHEQFTKGGGDNGGSTTNNGFNDMDDILFTLEENDNDFVNDLDSLSLHDSNQGKTLPSSELQRPPSSSTSNVRVTNEDNELPALLKSPVSGSPRFIYSNSSGGFNGFLKSFDSGASGGTGPGKENESSTDGRIKDSMTEQMRASRKSSASESKYKSGVYIPPHHRKNSTSKSNQNVATNEAILSVNNNSLDYSTSFRRRHQSGGNSYVPMPFLSSMNNSHSSFTTAVQADDIFAQANSEALVFEDDDIPASTSPRFISDHPSGRSMFGPYEIYNNCKIGLRTGRKSSTFQEEVVGSLEQYKNNWLILQQQQD